MKSCSPYYLLPALLLTAVGLFAHDQEKKDVVIRQHDRTAPRISIKVDNDGVNAPKESVTFLGVETGPVSRTLSAQLALPRDVGLVVARVSEGSPAATVLQENDILTKFDDQILVDPRQLSVLVRAKKNGDEVALTVYRGGKETTFKVKLGQREVSTAENMQWTGGGPEGGMRFFNFGSGGDTRTSELLREMPGMGRGDLDNVFRMISRERSAPLLGLGNVRVVRRSGKGGTVLDLPRGNFVFSDDEGTVELRTESDKRMLTVKDEKGKATFSGPVSTDEERKKIPADVMARLSKIELSFELGSDFEHEGAAVDDAKSKEKINFPGPMPTRRVLRQRSF